jgi:hypothetical protein
MDEISSTGAKLSKSSCSEVRVLMGERSLTDVPTAERCCSLLRPVMGKRSLAIIVLAYVAGRYRLTYV